LTPRARSRARSSATCDGRISGHAGLTLSRANTGTPRSTRRRPPLLCPPVLRPLQLRPRQRKGTTLDCKDSADIGARIPTEHCYTADKFDNIVRQIEDAQQMMRRAGACPNQGCGD
jgi:hypothetical protein